VDVRLSSAKHASDFASHCFSPPMSILSMVYDFLFFGGRKPAVTKLRLGAHVVSRYRSYGKKANAKSDQVLIQQPTHVRETCLRLLISKAHDVN